MNYTNQSNQRNVTTQPPQSIHSPHSSQSHNHQQSISTTRPQSEEPDFIESSVQRLEQDDHVSWVFAELLQGEVDIVQMLIHANLNRLNQIIQCKRSLTERSHLVEVLVAIQIYLCGKDRGEGALWLTQRKTPDGYRRDAVWELLTWISAASTQHKDGELIRKAMGRAFLHDELTRNILDPAKRSLDLIETVIRAEEDFYMMSIYRREDYFARKQSNYSKPGRPPVNHNHQYQQSNQHTAR